MKYAVAVLAVLALVEMPLLAHHGWGENETKISEITGTVTSGLNLSGAHATMKIKDAEGHIWEVTLAPPARTKQAGLKEGSLPVGATVMIHGNRNKNPKTFEMKVTRLTHNGTLYKIYPERD